MFQCYTTQAPEYLSTFVTKPHSRQIRSAEQNKLPLSCAELPNAKSVPLQYEALAYGMIYHLD